MSSPIRSKVFASIVFVFVCSMLIAGTSFPANTAGTIDPKAVSPSEEFVIQQQLNLNPSQDFNANAEAIAQSFTPAQAGKATTLAVKTIGFFNGNHVIVTAFIYEAPDPMNASTGNLLATSNSIVDPPDCAGYAPGGVLRTCDILLDFPASPMLRVGHSYLWLVTFQGMNSNGWGTNDGNTVGGLGWARYGSDWYNAGNRPGISLVPVNYYFKLSGEPLQAQTATGFYYPINQVIVGDANWSFCGDSYLEGKRHIGADLSFDSDKVGRPVYAISKGTVFSKQGPSECSGWGIGNYALAIRHSSTVGDFIAVYGHIQTTLNQGDTVDAGAPIGTIAHYEEHEKYGKDQSNICRSSGQIIVRGPHVHFGVFAGTDHFPSVGWGRVKDQNCMHEDNTNGFVNPLEWIRTRVPIN